MCLEWEKILLKMTSQVSYARRHCDILVVIVQPDAAEGNPQFAEHELLFWSDQEFAAAEERRTEILEASAVERNNADNLRGWLVLDASLAAVPSAPSRSAYCVALLAFKAYVGQ